MFEEIINVKNFVLLQDSELMELRQTIELLRKQSVEAGLTGHGSPSLARRHTINTAEADDGQY